MEGVSPAALDQHVRQILDITRRQVSEPKRGEVADVVASQLRQRHLVHPGHRRQLGKAPPPGVADCDVGIAS